MKLESACVSLHNFQVGLESLHAGLSEAKVKKLKVFVADFLMHNGYKYYVNAGSASLTGR